MKWPWVSRSRLDAETAQVEHLRSLLTVRDTRVASLETQLTALHRELLDLAKKVAAPPPPVVPPSPPVIDPEQSALTAIKDETIERMTEAFVAEGMTKEMAGDVARSLAREAELLFG